MNGFYIQLNYFVTIKTFDTDLVISIWYWRENLTTKSGIVSYFYKLLH